MSRRLQENIVALVILGIFIAAIVACLGYSPRARMVPVTISGLGVVLVLAQLALQNLRPEAELHVDLLEFLTTKHGSRAADADSNETSRDAAAIERSQQASRVREMTAFAIVGSLVALICVIGVIPSIFVFTAGYFVVTRQYHPLRSIAISACFTAAMYLIFAYGLDVQFDHNLFGWSLSAE